jgi:thiol-disulfide isomerase/thioredoxin
MNTKIISLNIFFSIYLIVSQTLAQTIKVKLDSLTTEDSGMMHVTVFEDSPKEKLILPKFDSPNVKFFDLFYSWDINDDHQISVAVIRYNSFDELFIDSNNDEDLRNDLPKTFLHSDNNFFFDAVSPADSQQKVKLKLYRKTSYPDSIQKKFVDSVGNLNPKFAMFYSSISNKSNFEGRIGTFYFDDRVTLRRGKVLIEGDDYQIGLFDFTNNGLWNDPQDLLLIDLNQDGKLFTTTSEEVFKLNDIFSIGANNYKIKNLDKYGTWLELEKTNEYPTFYYLKEQKSMFESVKGIEGTVEDFVWSLKLKDTKNNEISFADYKGKYLLLNFWGEWCGPCIAEIPELVEIYNEFPKERLEIVSFLKTQNLEKAKKLISEKNIKWPQILLTEGIEKKFRILAYPTNILVNPDSKTFYKYNQTTKKSLMDIIK